MNKEILKLAIPNIITNITIPLLGLVDIALLGHLNSPVYLAAVALGSMIFNILYWGMNFLRMSTTGFTSQAYGAKNNEEIAFNLNRSIIVGILIGLLLISLQYVIINISFSVLSAETETEKFASSYFLYRIWAAPASLALYGFYGWFIGMQNSKYPLIIAISINIINIIISYILIYHLNMNSDGAAIGTVVAQYSGALISVVLLQKKYKKYLKISYLLSSFKKSAFAELFKVNTNIFIRTLGIMLVMTFFTSVSANKSSLVLDANTILFQFYIFFSYYIDGFAYATESLTGKYKGRRDKLNLLKVLKKIFLWSFYSSLAFSVVYFLFGNSILHILTSQQNIVDYASKYIFWIWALPLVSFAAFIWDGVFVGITASKQMRNSMLIASLFVFFPVYYLFEKTIGNHALWLAMLLFLFTRGIIQTIQFKKII